MAGGSSQASWAYLVYGDVSALARVQQMAQSSLAVRWDGPYLDRYKVQPASLHASFLALYGADRVRFDTTGVLEPVHEEEGARLYRIVPGGAAGPG